MPFIAYTQPVQFDKDSIPTVQGRVIFHVHFEFNLDEKEFHQKIYDYLIHKFSPYSGKFLTDKKDYISCEVSDYLGIANSPIQKFGMYMTYNLHFEWEDGLCNMSLLNISYMKKGAFEADVSKKRKRTLTRFSAKEIMINKNFHLMFIGNVSERITELSINRINEIINDLYASFEKGRFIEVGSTEEIE